MFFQEVENPVKGFNLKKKYNTIRFSYFSFKRKHLPFPV